VQFWRDREPRRSRFGGCGPAGAVNCSKSAGGLGIGGKVVGARVLPRGAGQSSRRGRCRAGGRGPRQLRRRVGRGMVEHDPFFPSRTKSVSRRAGTRPGRRLPPLPPHRDANVSPFRPDWDRRKYLSPVNAASVRSLNCGSSRLNSLVASTATALHEVAAKHAPTRRGRCPTDRTEGAATAAGRRLLDYLQGVGQKHEAFLLVDSST